MTGPGAAVAVPVEQSRTTHIAVVLPRVLSITGSRGPPIDGLLYYDVRLAQPTMRAASHEVQFVGTPASRAR